MRNIHLPVWLGVVGRPWAATFAGLFALLSTSRALLITVVPLEAHSLLGDAQRVSALYFGVSLAGLCGSLAVPWLVHRIRRRRAFTLGALCAMAAPLPLATGTLPGLILGMTLYAFAVASLEITLNLYLMDHIPRRDFGRFEPVRVLFAAGAWTLGPWLGVYLETQVAHWLPFACAAAAALCLLGVFWYLRLTEHPAVAPAKGPPPNPVAYLPHYFGQPRLRLAWVLAVGRSGWWAMFFVYAPIYAVSAGLGEVASGAIVSLGTASFFSVPLWGWVGRRYGLRRLLVGGYLATGAATLAVAFAAQVPWLGAAILVLAALSAGTIDAAGNTPFLRAVHPLERPQMTAVFATYRDASQLLPPGLFTLLLKVFELPAVFATGGLAMLVLARYAGYIPRRL